MAHELNGSQAPLTAESEAFYSYPAAPRSQRAADEHTWQAAAGTRERRDAIASLRYRYLKRFLDILFSLIALPFLAPVLLVITLVIKATSPGPVFFSHRRLCRNGAFFSMWKFRTMCVNSNEVLELHLARNPEARAEWARTHKLRRDPRITAVGSFLRRYSMDELPQIWNVLGGRMSLVGPRPIVAAEVEKYGQSFSCYTRVKPGVSGLWQVSGRSTLSYPERVALDCEYVRTWSLWRDLMILLATFRSVVDQDGAF